MPDLVRDLKAELDHALSAMQRAGILVRALELDPPESAACSDCAESPVGLCDWHAGLLRGRTERNPDDPRPLKEQLRPVDPEMPSEQTQAYTNMGQDDPAALANILDPHVDTIRSNLGAALAGLGIDLSTRDLAIVARKIAYPDA